MKKILLTIVWMILFITFFQYVGCKRKVSISIDTPTIQLKSYPLSGSIWKHISDGNDATLTFADTTCVLINFVTEPSGINKHENKLKYLYDNIREGSLTASVQNDQGEIVTQSIGFFISNDTLYWSGHYTTYNINGTYKTDVFYYIKQK